MSAPNAAYDRLPSYAELLERRDAPPGSSWGLFEDSNDLGTLNFLTPERVRAATALVRRGVIFNLDLPLNAFDVPLVPHRETLQHVIFGNGTSHRDDHIALYNQAATHVDGLRHARHHVYGYYDDAPADAVESGQRLGIERWSQSGIVGRAILIDLPRHLASIGGPSLDPCSNAAISVDLLQDALSSQGTERKPGDIILLRTGWLHQYLGFDAADQAVLRSKLRSPGIEQSEAMIEWLWDTRVAAILADNPAVECLPPIDTSPFHVGVGDGTGFAEGLMHTHLIALLGLVLGELWALDELACDCARDGLYEALFVAKPLNLHGGVGSPANAIAIR